MSDKQTLRLIEQLLCRFLHKRFGYGAESAWANAPGHSDEIDLLLAVIHELHIEDEQRQGNPFTSHNRCHQKAWLLEDPYEAFDALIEEEERRRVLTEILSHGLSRCEASDLAPRDPILPVPFDFPLRRYSQWLYPFISRYNYGSQTPYGDWSQIPKAVLQRAMASRKFRFIKKLTEKHLKAHLEETMTYYYTGSRRENILLLCLDVDGSGVDDRFPDPLKRRQDRPGLN